MQPATLVLFATVDRKWRQNHTGTLLFLLHGLYFLRTMLPSKLCHHHRQVSLDLLLTKWHCHWAKIVFLHSVQDSCWLSSTAFNFPDVKNNHKPQGKNTGSLSLFHFGLAVLLMKHLELFKDSSAMEAQRSITHYSFYKAMRAAFLCSIVNVKNKTTYQ